MKWNRYYPKDGHVRYIKRFLFLPLTIEHQTRWLEIVEIRQIFRERKCRYDKSAWQNINFKL